MIGDRPIKETFRAFDRKGKAHWRRAARPLTFAVMVYPEHAPQSAMRAEFFEAEGIAGAVRDRWIRAGFQAEIVQVEMKVRP